MGDWNAVFDFVGWHDVLGTNNSRVNPFCDSIDMLGMADELNSETEGAEFDSVQRSLHRSNF